MTEYRFVDLDAEVADVYRLDEAARHGPPMTLAADDTRTCRAAPGFGLAVADVPA